ncbi:hypothetical protein [Kribbella steppae]|uniref:hypothetical protein n=1 Tax=Kribbella steppae TaxID=2512223 RepID=UPI001049F810|nr:hypothetical protein [Kribbella steppae]
MAIEFDDRPSESPYIERVWRSRSDAIDRMTSIATAHWTLVAWRAGRTWRVAVQGPESGATTARVPTEEVRLHDRPGTDARVAQRRTGGRVDR